MRRIKGLLLALAFFAGPVTTSLAHASIAHAAVPAAVSNANSTASLPLPMSSDAMNATIGAGFWSSLGEALVKTLEFAVIAAALFYGIEVGIDIIT